MDGRLYLWVVAGLSPSWSTSDLGTGLYMTSPPAQSQHHARNLILAVRQLGYNARWLGHVSRLVSRLRASDSLEDCSEWSN